MLSIFSILAFSGQLSTSLLLTRGLRLMFSQRMVCQQRKHKTQNVNILSPKYEYLSTCPLHSRSCNWMDAIVAVIIVNSKTQNKYNNFTTRGDVCALIRLPPILDYLDLVSLFIKLRCIEALVPGASWRHTVYLWRAAAQPRAGSRPPRVVISFWHLIIGQVDM